MSRAGDRTPKFRRNPAGMGRLADNKLGILVTSITKQLAIQALDPQQWDEENDIELESEQGDNINLLITVPGRRSPLVWNLSNMTHAELEATRQFFDYLFNLADPIVRERDRVANDAFSRGDDSFIRVYRAVPQLVTRPRKVTTDSQGIHDGPEDAPQGP